MLSRVLIVALCVGMTFAATWRGKPPVKPKEFEDKQGCFIEEIKDVIPYGKTIAPVGYCYRISCEQGMISYASCGVVGTDDPKCHITEIDLSKPHPACCPTIKCDVDNHIE